MQNETIEQCAERIVRQEVLVCVSALVSTLATCAGDVSGATQLGELAEKAFKLASPIEDWEEAAIQEGWTMTDHTGPMFFHIGKGDEPRVTVQYDSWQSLCEAYDIEPYQWEVFEHWAVSQWLADKLTALGERVDTDFEGLNVWARTCTGQGIACDGVLQAIAREVLKA